MIVTIHQPEHLIWLGLVEKISQADIFVVLDNVQFEKNNVQNRNKIRTKDGWVWVTVPVKGHPLSTLIKDIEISDHFDWKARYLGQIRVAYGQSKYFLDYYPQIERIILQNHKNLSALNLELVKFILESFGVKPKIMLSSEMNLPATDFKGGVVLEICRALGADTYISGAGGKNYLDVSLFDKIGTKVVFQEFHCSIYKQQSEPFIPGMSSIDLLFNYGPESKVILLDEKK